jgi:Kef-type K+ transport system membrane component KefB
MDIGYILLELFIILMAAKIGGELAERVGQPAVLGELVFGVMVGGSVLGWVPKNEMIDIFAQLGVIILLFEVGIASDFEIFMKAGLQAFVVASVGVICPFIGGYFLASYLGLSPIQAVFLGATLTATSVGITVRVFNDLGHAKRKEAIIVIGAAVIDDVMGLIILAVLVGLMTTGSISLNSIITITLIAIFFLVASIAISSVAAPYVLAVVHQMRIRGFLFVFAFCFCLLLAYLAKIVGLAPIVGAFAAGLILSRTEHKEHIEERIKPVADLFVPIFFIMMGVVVDIKTLNPFIASNLHNIIIALSLFAVAVIGKYISGFSIPWTKVNRSVIGFGMIPRGEVGLIFASYGIAHKIIDSSLYTSVLIMIMLTTFMTPPLLKGVFKLESKRG